MITNIIEKYGDKLSQIDYVDTFHALQRRYEQNKEILVGSDKSPRETNQRYDYLIYDHVFYIEFTRVI